MNQLDPNIADDMLVKDLPATYKNEGVVYPRIEAAKYPAGSMLSKMQAMIQEAEGRFLIVFRRPSYGCQGGYPKAMMFGSRIITKLFPATMHMGKCILKRWLKLTVHHAIDRDEGKLDGPHLQDVQQLCADAGCPFALRTSKKNPAYPKIVMAEDYGPLSKLLKRCGTALVDAAGFGQRASYQAAPDGTPHSQADEPEPQDRPSNASTNSSSTPDPGNFMGIFNCVSANENSDKAAAWKKHLELLQLLIDMIKVKGCYSEEDKEKATTLGTDILFYYLKAGMPHKKLSNYYLLLLFIGEWQPPRNVNHLIMGQFLHCPRDWDPWDRPARCLKEVSDEVTELSHFIAKLVVVNN
jgi:hypothetical protein